MFARGVNAYRQVQVQTANPGQLLIQLYEGALSYLERGISALESGDRERAHQLLVRVQDFMTELRATLNHDAGPIAATLDQMYAALNGKLVEANVRKEPEPAREVAAALRELLVAWRTAVNEVNGFAPERPAVIDAAPHASVGVLR